MFKFECVWLICMDDVGDRENYGAKYSPLAIHLYAENFCSREELIISTC